MRTMSMTTARRMAMAAFLGLGLAWPPAMPTACAFPMDGHLHGADDLAGILDLAGTPVGKGGVGPTTPEQARAVSRWMDHPATRIGQTRNLLAGGAPLSPSNHRAQRHNPVRTARVFSGDGSVSPNALNQARMHKLQDIAAARGVEGGRAFVDGHKVTSPMQTKAQAILRYARRHNRLPPAAQLPHWLDNSGSGMARSTTGAAAGKTAVKASASGAAQVGRAKDAARATTKAAGKIVVAPLVVGLLALEAYDTESAYVRGDLDDAQRAARHAASGLAMAGGLAGAKAGSCAGAAIGTMILPGVGTLIGGVAGGLAGGLAGHFGTRVAAEHVGDRWCEEAAGEDELLRRQWQEMHPEPAVGGS